jgi:hypothetical protein
MQVLSYNQCADRAGITRRTFEREIAHGRGPAIVEISARRRGVLETDFEEWLLSRRRPAPVLAAAVRRGPGRPRKLESAFPPLPESHPVSRVSNDPEDAESRASSKHRESLAVGRDGECYGKP